MPLNSLPLSDALQSAATEWVHDYDDLKLPWEPTHDEVWLARGRQLLADLRGALGPLSIVVQPDEDYWEPSADAE